MFKKNMLMIYACVFMCVHTSSLCIIFYFFGHPTLIQSQRCIWLAGVHRLKYVPIPYID